MKDKRVKFPWDLYWKNTKSIFEKILEKRLQHPLKAKVNGWLRIQ